MVAYYNEIDPYAAQFLENLIAAGHIAPGIVDRRSIEDVRPDELSRFTQCHFFAGVGVWSYALRRAGWSDDRPVWTGSCPCQSFSAAGKGLGFADERHLWPAWFHLIAHGKREDVPIFGEQVASKDALAWLDLVQADLEGEGYTVGANDICAAGFGCPGIRQRLFWVADSENGGRIGREIRNEDGPQCEDDSRRKDEGLRLSESGDDKHYGGLADAEQQRLERYAGHGDDRDEPGRHGARQDRPVMPQGTIGRMEYPDSAGRKPREPSAATARYGDTVKPAGGNDGPGPVNGFWANADWLGCRDERWRPVESGTFPLAHGASARVGRLRAYGNAINAEVAAEFITAYRQARGEIA